ncbi:hypothetical protein QQS21_000840 [Conoideocrella luteorostrata]|uniref:Rhodopsin domain-containing protein n=1 Tax=Conoideocrella luteorostrata TaxID=1105319 RepID=A0AAJ0G3S1_9HYPO|nr:hypothetical protein QQS21_000840 [Conoideocrella luteorostrata]
MARDFPESDDAALWRRVNTAVPLTFGIIATVAYTMRLYATVMIVRRVRVEDYLMGLAVLLMIGNTASVLIKASNGMGVPDADLPQYRRVNFKLGSWLVIKFWSSSMTFAKLAIILFLRRVVGGKRSNRIALDVLAALVVVWGASNFFYTIWFCTPVAYYWDRSIEGGQCVSNSLYMIESKTIAWSALVMDLAILGIPVPTIWHLRITLRQKIGITFILCIGVIVCIFSGLRAVQFAFFDTSRLSSELYPKKNVSGMFLCIMMTSMLTHNLASSILQGLWTVLENQFTVLCGCLPQLGPFVRRQNANNILSSGKGSGYLGSYEPPNTIRSWGLQRINAIQTSVSGAHDAADGRSKSNSGWRERQNSSELELRGIEVQTTIDQEVSIGHKCEYSYNLR